MSRFFVGTASSCSSESEEEEEEQAVTRPAGLLFTDSKEEEDTKRVVRSAKEKRYEQLHTIIQSIRNSKKIKDFYKMETSLEELCCAYEKAKPVIAKEEKGITPRFYISILVEMEDLINQTWEDTDGRKKMNKNNAKCLGILRKKLTKYIKAEFTNDVVGFRKNPDKENKTDLISHKSDESSESSSDDTLISDESSESSADDKDLVEDPLTRTIKKLHEIMAARGKKRTSEKEQINLLSKLLDSSNENNLGVGVGTKIQFAIVAAIFDYNPQISGAMKVQIWERCMQAVEELLRLIEENTNILQTGEHINEEIETFDHPPYKVRGCFLSCVERADEEFTKILKSSDPHSHEYIDRLRDEPRIIKILERAQKMLNSPSELCRIYLKRIEHIYFKFDPAVITQKDDCRKIENPMETTLQIMDKFCKYIYASDNSRLRTQAILCQIYHHAIHDNYSEARDLMLMSHLQDNISHSDPPLQIMYNRTMVQLGLCAFRYGQINDAHNALLDIQQSRRSKELLGQGLLPQRQYERSEEEEKIEKQRQLPFHMHINLEMFECVYMVSAMLIEIPYMAAHEFAASRRMISKPYFQQLRSYDRLDLVGPPESTREHVLGASKAMRNGDWKKSCDLIINEKMNTKVWNLFHEADKVRTMLSRKVKEESLRTYLFTFSKAYDSISLETLREMFELEKESVYAIVSKLIINNELMASMDEPSQCIIMHKTEPSSLQSLSLQLAHKLTQLTENNERLLDPRPGGSQGNWKGREGNRGGNYMKNSRRMQD